jgi:hypothetical protein
MKTECCMKPVLVPCVAEALTLDPTPGIHLAEILEQPAEMVFEALIWMESRGYATLRPVTVTGPRGGTYGGYGWVPGRNEMRKAA